MITLKKWNGTVWVEESPKTTVSTIVASGTPSASTFLRGDGAWAPAVVLGETPSGTDYGCMIYYCATLGSWFLTEPATNGHYLRFVTGVPTWSSITFDNNIVTNAMLSDMAANTIKGAVSAGDPVDLTPAQVKTMLSLTNVTNDAQVKKLASSTNGNVPTWNGTTGDALANGYTVQTTLASSTTALVRADAILTALNLKANLASPTFTGQVAYTPTTLGTTGTINIDFTGANYRTMAALTGAITFTATNRANGRSVTIRIINGTTTRALTFPTGWVFMGTKPTQILASKRGVLTVTCFGTADTDCIAVWAVQL